MLRYAFLGINHPDTNIAGEQNGVYYGSTYGPGCMGSLSLYTVAQSLTGLSQGQINEFGSYTNHYVDPSSGLDTIYGQIDGIYGNNVFGVCAGSHQREVFVWAGSKYSEVTHVYSVVFNYKDAQFLEVVSATVIATISAEFATHGHGQGVYATPPATPYMCETSGKLCFDAARNVLWIAYATGYGSNAQYSDYETSLVRESTRSVIRVDTVAKTAQLIDSGVPINGSAPFSITLIPEDGSIVIANSHWRLARVSASGAAGFIEESRAEPSTDPQYVNQSWRKWVSAQYSNGVLYALSAQFNDTGVQWDEVLQKNVDVVDGKPGFYVIPYASIGTVQGHSINTGTAVFTDLDTGNPITYPLWVGFGNIPNSMFHNKYSGKEDAAAPTGFAVVGSDIYMSISNWGVQKATVGDYNFVPVIHTQGVFGQFEVVSAPIRDQYGTALSSQHTILSASAQGAGGLSYLMDVTAGTKLFLGFSSEHLPSLVPILADLSSSVSVTDAKDTLQFAGRVGYDTGTIDALEAADAVNVTVKALLVTGHVSGSDQPDTARVRTACSAHIAILPLEGEVFAFDSSDYAAFVGAGSGGGGGAVSGTDSADTMSVQGVVDNRRWICDLTTAFNLPGRFRIRVRARTVPHSDVGAFTGPSHDLTARDAANNTVVSGSVFVCDQGTGEVHGITATISVPVSNQDVLNGYTGTVTSDPTTGVFALVCPTASVEETVNGVTSKRHRRVLVTCTAVNAGEQLQQTLALELEPGKTIYVPDFVFRVGVEEVAATSSSETVTAVEPYTGALGMYPLFGAEADNYYGLVYGRGSLPGMPTGKFWDMRAVPVPFKPHAETSFAVVTESGAIGKLFRMRVYRENEPATPCSKTFDFIPDNEDYTISLQLGRGLNLFDIYAQDALGGWRRVYSVSVTATLYAQILHGYATVLTRYATQPLDTFNNELASEASTMLANPLIGFDALLPAKQNLFRMARQLVVDAQMTGAGTSAGVTGLGSSLFQQTPLLVRALASDAKNHIDINSTWLAPIPTHGQSMGNNAEYHVWSLSRTQARDIAVRKYLASNFGADTEIVGGSSDDFLQVLRDGSLESSAVAVTESGSVSLGGDIEADDTETAETTPRTYWEISVVSETEFDGTGIGSGPDLELFRDQAVIVFPGLFDNGAVPFFDVGAEFDTSNFDKADSSGDIMLDGFQGVRVTAEESSNRTLGTGTGVIDRSVAEFVVVCTPSCELDAAEAGFAALTAPVIEPAAGTYDMPVLVTIGMSAELALDPTAQILYTVDGRDPAPQPDQTIGVNVYEGPFQLLATHVVKAVVVTEYGISPISMVSYTANDIYVNVSTPWFSPPADIAISFPTQVHIYADSDAVIHYTVDGSTPTESSPVYAGTGIVIDSESDIVKAIGVRGQYKSAVALGSWLKGNVEIPVPKITPGDGAWALPCYVGIAFDVNDLANVPANTVIKYTLDGTEPGLGNGTIYTGVITLEHSALVRAIAVSGADTSGLAGANLTVTYPDPVSTSMLSHDPTAADLGDRYEWIGRAAGVPTFSPNPGTYFDVTDITINRDTGSKVYYTTDGSDPRTSQTAHILALGAVIQLSMPTTIRAAAKAGASFSGVAEGYYNVAPTPVIDAVTGFLYVDKEQSTLELQGMYFSELSTANVKYVDNGNEVGFSAISISAASDTKSCSIAFKLVRNNTFNPMIRKTTGTLTVANGPHKTTVTVHVYPRYEFVAVNAAGLVGVTAPISVDPTTSVGDDRDYGVAAYTSTALLYDAASQPTRVVPQGRTLSFNDPLTIAAMSAATRAPITLTDTTKHTNTVPGDVIAAALASLAEVLGKPEAFYKIEETCVSYINDGGSRPAGLFVSVGTSVYAGMWYDEINFTGTYVTNLNWIKLFTTPYPVQRILDTKYGFKVWIIPLPQEQWDTTPISYSNSHACTVRAHGIGVFTTHRTCVDAADIVNSIGPLYLRSKLPALYSQDGDARWHIIEGNGVGNPNLFAVLSDHSAKPMTVVNGNAVIDTDASAGLPLLLVGDIWGQAEHTWPTPWCGFNTLSRFSYTDPSGDHEELTPPKIIGVTAMANHDIELNVQHLLAVDARRGVAYGIKAPYQSRAHIDSNPSSPLPVTYDAATVYVAASNHYLGTETDWLEATLRRGTYTDARDGVVYRTLRMPDGNWWTVDNFKYATASSVAPNGQVTNIPEYGRLYTTADAIANAPAGCRLPTWEEYANLFKFTGKTQHDLQYVTWNGVTDVPIPDLIGRIFWGVTGQLIAKSVSGPNAAGRGLGDNPAYYDPLKFDLKPAGYFDGTEFRDFLHNEDYIFPVLMTTTGYWHQYWNVSDLALEHRPYLGNATAMKLQGSVRFIVESGNVPDVDPTNYVHHSVSAMSVKDESRGVTFMQLMRTAYRTAIVKHY